MCVGINVLISITTTIHGVFNELLQSKSMKWKMHRVTNERRNLSELITSEDLTVRKPQLQKVRHIIK